MHFRGCPEVKPELKAKWHKSEKKMQATAHISAIAGFLLTPIKCLALLLLSGKA